MKFKYDEKTKTIIVDAIDNIILKDKNNYSVEFDDNLTKKLNELGIRIRLENFKIRTSDNIKNKKTNSFTRIYNFLRDGKN